MKKNWIINGIGGLLGIVISSGLFAKLPDNYQNLSASEKSDLLWAKIINSNIEDPYPPLSINNLTEVLEKLKGLFKLSPSFDNASDEMLQDRKKIIHINGSVGKIRFLPTNQHPFTGIYQSGGIGLARLSLAISPSEERFIPGMAIKILLSKQASLNLHVMNSLEGQNENWNFFAKDFSNQVDHPNSWVLKAIETIFSWTRDPANNLPLWHLAAWTSEGPYDGIPVYPERLYFRPSQSVSHVIPENSREDFRISLSQIAPGPLYEVYGDYQGRLYYIGTLILESPLLASNYGDQTLFFQHQR